ncbi:MAG: hypothetical protein ACE5DO_13490 [Desulfobacterales bacterium]
MGDKNKRVYIKERDMTMNKRRNERDARVADFFENLEKEKDNSDHFIDIQSGLSNCFTLII